MSIAAFAHPTPLGQYTPMSARNRKLVGTIVLVIFLGAYAWVAVEVGAGRISHAPHWAQFAYFLMAGLLWVIPAGVLIRWMQRPD